MPRPAPGCSRPGAHRPILAIPFSLHLLLLPETPAARRAGRISECARTRVLTAGSRAPVQQALLGVAAGSQLAPEANLLVAPLEGEDLVHAHLIVVEGQLRVHGYKPGSGAPRFGVRLCSRKWHQKEKKAWRARCPSTTRPFSHPSLGLCVFLFSFFRPLISGRCGSE